MIRTYRKETERQRLTVTREALLERFDLSGAANRPAKTYSGGMRRRLDLAASMIGRPAVLYLDEPTTGLDPRTRNEVWEEVRRLVGDGVERYDVVLGHLRERRTAVRAASIVLEHVPDLVRYGSKPRREAERLHVGGSLLREDAGT